MFDFTAARQISEPLVCLSEYQIDRLFGFACGTDDEAFVVLKHPKPVLNVGRAVAEASGGFEPRVVDQRCCTDFRDQLFFAVGFRAEEGSFFQAVEPGFVAGAVNHFVEGRAVVFSGFLELGKQRERDAIRRRSVEGFPQQMSLLISNL